MRSVGRWPITAEAAILLTGARLLIVAAPYRRWSRLLGVTAIQPGPTPPSSSNPQHVSIRRALDAAAARIPWHSSCLVKAIAGHWMLRRRHAPSSLVIGVTREDTALQAHAWLLAGGAIVCGGSESARYVPIAAFGAHSSNVR